MNTGFSACFSTVLVSAALAGTATHGSAETLRSAVTVLLQNDARVPAAVAAAAQAEVVRLFDLANIDVVWVTKVPGRGVRLRVISLVTWEPRHEASALGLTYGTPAKRATRAYVFWRRIERTSTTFTAALQNVLAVAIAHELGHMLLPDGSHVGYGIMAASWGRDDIRSASAGLLHFSKETAALMTRGLHEEVRALAARPE